MPNSPITGPCTDPHFADPGQTSPPNGWGRAPERVDRGRMYLSNCPLQQVNRTRNLDGAGPECGQNSTESGASRAAQRGQMPRRGLALWLHPVGPRQEFGVLDQWIGSAFPNSTAPNPMELPPPLL